MKSPKCSARGCRNAAIYFAPRTGLRKRLGWCSDECGVVVAMDAKRRKAVDMAKVERRENQARKRAIEPVGALLKRVERECNAYIKELYYGEPCFTCRKNRDRLEAGHYMPVGRGGGSPVRFHINNIRPQCHPCNVYDGGGKHENYRPNLVAQIGEEAVLEIEGMHKGHAKWDRDDLERQRAWFAAETRRMKKERGQC